MLAEHMRKYLKLNISANSNMIFKNLVLQALGTIRIQFMQKSKKKIHACVPLQSLRKEDSLVRGMDLWIRIHSQM
jgi:hypothetical protein